VTANHSPGETYNPEWEPYDASDSPAMVVFGSRKDVPTDVVERAVYRIPRVTTLINGGARGVDWDALVTALARRMSVIVMPAQWGVYGNSAGPIRNGWMANVTDSGHGIIRTDSSPGSWDMVGRLKLRGKPVEITRV
jgi:hypothetical protein